MVSMYEKDVYLRARLARYSLCHMFLPPEVLVCPFFFVGREHALFFVGREPSTLHRPDIGQQRATQSGALSKKIA